LLEHQKYQRNFTLRHTGSAIMVLLRDVTSLNRKYFFLLYCASPVVFCVIITLRSFRDSSGRYYCICNAQSGFVYYFY